MVHFYESKCYCCDAWLHGVILQKSCNEHIPRFTFSDWWTHLFKASSIYISETKYVTALCMCEWISYCVYIYVCISVCLDWFVARVCMFGCVCYYKYSHMLKLPSLLVAWFFWTFHNKSHNMKALVILSHSWITISATFVDLCVTFWSIFLKNNSSQITHANHITMTTSRQIWAWRDYSKTKANVNIRLLELCDVYILLSKCQWVHMALAISRHDIPWCKIVMRNFYKIILV